MSTYLNIYLIDKETKAHRKLCDYGGSSEFCSILSEVCNIPYLDDEDKEEQHAELSSAILNRCIEIVNVRLEEADKIERHRQEAYKETKEMMVSVLAIKSYSLEEIKTIIQDFTWENTGDDYENNEYIENLKKAKEDFLFYQDLLHSFKDEDVNFCGIIINKC